MCDTVATRPLTLLVGHYAIAGAGPGDGQFESRPSEAKASEAFQNTEGNSPSCGSGGEEDVGDDNVSQES